MLRSRGRCSGVVVQVHKIGRGLHGMKAERLGHEEKLGHMDHEEERRKGDGWGG